MSTFHLSLTVPATGAKRAALSVIQCPKPDCPMGARLATANVTSGSGGAHGTPASRASNADDCDWQSPNCRARSCRHNPIWRGLNVTQIRLLGGQGQVAATQRVHPVATTNPVRMLPSASPSSSSTLWTTGTRLRTLFARQKQRQATLRKCEWPSLATITPRGLVCPLRSPGMLPTACIAFGDSEDVRFYATLQG